MFFLEKKKCRVRHGLLVLDVNSAKVPGTVCVNLQGIPFSHFHVRSGEQGSDLGYADAQGKFVTLATFADRADADKALNDVHKTLISSPYAPLYKGFQLLTLLLAAGFILLLAAALITQIRQRPPMMVNSSAAVPRAAPVAPQPGSPVDADSRLGTPED